MLAVMWREGWNALASTVVKTDILGLNLAQPFLSAWIAKTKIGELLNVSRQMIIDHHIEAFLLMILKS